MGVRLSSLIDARKNASATFVSLNVQTGILAAIAAETASAGHLIGLPNTKSHALHLTWARLVWRSTTAPSSAQSFGFSLKKATAYTVAHTGGGTGGANASLFLRNSGHSTRDAASGQDGSGLVARVAGDAALTAGTHTLGGRILHIGGDERVAAATVKLQILERERKSSDLYPLAIVKSGEGLIVTNDILMANSLAGVLSLELEGFLRPA